MAWCSCAPAPRVSDFNVDVQNLGLGDDLEKKNLPPAPMPRADDDEDDDYDPRKPEFIIPASPEETGAKDATLVRQQICHLRSMIARRKDQADRTLDPIIDHYEKVLEELGHVLRHNTLTPRTSLKIRRSIFADLSGETSPANLPKLSLNIGNLPKLPPSPARSNSRKFSRTGTPDKATSLPKKLSPSARHGCLRTLIPLVSGTADRVPDKAHHSLTGCDSPPVASEGNDSSALSSIHTPQKANPTKATVKLLPSPGSGTEMKKSYLKSSIHVVM